MANSPLKSRTFRLQRVAREAEAALDTALSRFEVSAAQARTLELISGGRVRTIRALAARLQVDGAAVTRLVDRLEAKGFVAREPDSADRRSVIITMTAPGSRLAPEIAAALAVAEKAFFDIAGAAGRKRLDRGLAALMVGHGMARLTKSGKLRNLKH